MVFLPERCHPLEGGVGDTEVEGGGGEEEEEEDDGHGKADDHKEGSLAEHFKFLKLSFFSFHRLQVAPVCSHPILSVQTRVDNRSTGSLEFFVKEGSFWRIYILPFLQKYSARDFDKTRITEQVRNQRRCATPGVVD